MGLLDIHEQESDLILVLTVNFVQCPSLGRKGSSGVTAKDQERRLAATERGERYAIPVQIF